MHSPVSRSADATPHPGLGFRAFVTLIASMMAINALTIDIMLPALAPIGDALSVSEPNDRQWIITSYMLGFGVAQLAYGPLSDRFGRKPVLIAGISLYVVATLLAALASTFPMMIAARVFQGVASASTRVLAVSIVRDCYSGRTMARVMSLAMIVFLGAPILAPSIGQIILLAAPWRWIFGALAIFATAVLITAAFRLPETLKPQDRRAIRPGAIANAARQVLTNRVSLGYTLATTMMFGSLLSFISSSQQLFADTFGAASLFPLIFAACAGTMAVASFTNSRLVERLGTRRISHSALLAYLAIVLTHLAIALAGLETIWTFSILQALMMGCLGLASSNFGSMAMEPVGHIAGTASSLQGAISTVGASLIGIVVGQSFDGTSVPLSLGYAGCGLATLVIVLVTERGRLFRPSAVPAPAQ